jgi:MFS family permease
VSRPPLPTRWAGATAYLAFGAFGAFWGAWGASVPRVQAQAGVSDGQLGLALMFVGAGALPAMLAAGHALDRFGLRLAGPGIAALGVSGVLLVAVTRDLVTLAAALVLVGATSGAADVAMNAVAGRAERLTGRPVVTRAHGTFSVLVVLGSLGAGAAAGAGMGTMVPFAVVLLASAVAGAVIWHALPHGRGLPARCPGERPAAVPGAVEPVRLPWTLPVVLLGILGGLAFATENAHQSWSAVFAHAELDTGLGAAAVAPAVFAAVVAASRFLLGGLGGRHPAAVLAGGSLLAAVGSVVVAVAPSLLVAAAGLAMAAAGTGVLFPTVIGLVTRLADEEQRGRVTSRVTTVAYLGFLLGPVYVGAWAELVGLRGAMAAVAALVVLLALLAGPVVRRSGG